jgi:ElaB/YqjD/DUF883 family membrane-anchored ribosome-binding protein
MPNGKRDRSIDRPGTEDGGTMEKISDQAREVGGSLREGAERVGERMREGYEAAGEAISRGYGRAEDMVGRHPMQSVLIGFGLGFGLGMLLTIALTPREEPRWRDWRFADLLHRIQDQLGQRS